LPLLRIGPYLGRATARSTLRHRRGRLDTLGAIKPKPLPRVSGLEESNLKDRHILLDIRVKRLDRSDWFQAQQLFCLMAAVFEENCEPLSECYLRKLLSNPDFWALAAFVGDEMAGGISAHTLAMTRGEFSEIFVFDIAVRGEYQKQGVGRKLVECLRSLASESDIHEIFVAADNKDEHALDFYNRLGGAPLASTVFSFTKV
jgi:aminoglycoside 3-N-acetyltransferase I